MDKAKEIENIRKKFDRDKDFVTPVGDPRKTKQWKKYESIQNLPMFRNKISTASDGREVNIGWATGQYKKKIEGLPDKEVEELLKKKALYSKLFMKGLQLKKAAYLSVTEVKNAKIGRSILDAKKAEILELFGRMFRTKEVHKVVVEDWGIEISLQALEKYRKKYKEIINQKIEEFKRDYSDVRLSIKKSRLEELTWMYSKRKRIYESTSNREDHKLLLNTIEQIRKEAEGDSIRINGKIEFEQEQSIQQHMMTEAFKYLNIKQLVLARIAAQYKRNPIVLQKAIAEAIIKSFLIRLPLNLSQAIPLVRHTTLRV